MRRTVRGILELGQVDPPAGPVHVRVRIEDVTRADAASTVLASVEFDTSLTGEGGATEVAFEVPVDTDRIDERHVYVVRAHVDVSGSGQVRSGDYLTTQSYPVLTQGAGDDIRVGLRRI